MGDIGNMDEQGAKEAESSSNTPYDDAFRILMTWMGPWIIPLLNEIFHLDPPLPPDTVITSEAGELYHEDADGDDKKVIADSVLHADDKRYHVECQSNDDLTITIRMTEYDMDIALRNATKGAMIVEFPLPYSAVIYLRTTASTPQHLIIRITDEAGGRLDHHVEVMRMSDYTIDNLKEKDLLFLLPFYMFNHEKDFKKAENGDEAEYRRMAASVNALMDWVNIMYEQGTLSGERYTTLTRMFQSVTDALTKNYKNLRKELDTIMSGRRLADPVEELRAEGRAEGRAEAALRMIDLRFTDEDIAHILDMPLEDVKALHGNTQE